jgi:ketose-bisphosphate aldolase
VTSLIERNRMTAFVGLSELLKDAADRHYAVGAFNFCNAETAQAVVETAVAMRSPVIMMIGPGEFPLLGVRAAADIAKSAARDAGVPVCLHLDHAYEYELVAECIDAGFPSVMIDASRLPFEENIALTSRVIEIAKARGVDVEAELGAVGRVDDCAVEGGSAECLTSPSEAAEFCDRTGVDALAVAIGNAHGIYTQRPELDFVRLQEIRDATGVPLVLHGGSGTPLEQLQRSIEIGVSKVNVASELSRAYLAAVTKGVADAEGKAWYGTVLTDAKAAVAAVVADWMNKLGSAGMA